MDTQDSNADMQITGAAITGTGSSRTAYLLLGGCWIQPYRNTAGRWAAVTPEPQPLSRVFPEVAGRMPFGEQPRVDLMFHAGTTTDKSSSEAGRWLSFRQSSPGGRVHHIIYNADTRASADRQPDWWPEGEESVVGAAALPSGSVLYATRDRVRVYSPGATSRRDIGLAPVGTTALCYDPDQRAVYFFTDPTTVHIAKLAGAQHSIYAFAAPPAPEKITAIWPK
ncbi:MULTISPECIES: hypothetical protein [unclassified Streptomyces]|uniref:hypothetical protein n=1 Tax=unclassified Streptomyces TaxID=2593676 RepID=UPI0037F339A7